MKGKHGLPQWYWDSCVMLAWLHDDWAGVPGVMEGIEEMAEAINAGKAVMFTSVATKTEVLDYRLTPKARQMFGDLFKRRNVSFVAQDERIGDLSHAIRNHYAQQPKKVVLESMDCIHLATAILYRADCMYTLDGAGPRKRKTDLIPLNGNVMGHALRIEMPVAKQARLVGLEPAKKKPGES
jgi:uncharacterized protein with PIN domain